MSINLPCRSLSRRSFYFAQMVVLAIGLMRCANTIAPEGGPRDETPPQVVPEESTPNYQTNFEKQDIDITFDEWVVVEEPSQIIVSPPIENNDYDVLLRKKTVRFTFGEEVRLRENATYTINFGEAVQDLTEGNPAEDLQFVFATGDQLDSLKVRGLIVDARTGEPVKEALFLLYDNLADSVVRTERPFYFAKTGENGRFQINNVKEGTFKGFALVDSRPNYQFDEGETIGFPDSLIVLTDSTQPDLTIRTFEEAGPPDLQEEETDNFGIVKLKFEDPVKDLDVQTPNGPALFPEYDRDTLKVWYASEQTSDWSLIVSKDMVFRDTFRIGALPEDDFINSARFRLLSPQNAQGVHPAKPLRLTFNHPVAGLDTTLISFLADTLRTPVRPTLEIDSVNQRILSLQHNWKAGLPYFFQILPGGIYDIYGLPNSDTIVLDLNAKLRKDYGNINLTLTGLDSLGSYIVQLIGKSDAVVEEFLVSQQADVSHTFSLITPGEYTVRLIRDVNGNGEWDTGNYDLKRQPEPITLEKLEQLRANWDLDARINFREGPGPPGK